MRSYRPLTPARLLLIPKYKPQKSVPAAQADALVLPTYTCQVLAEKETCGSQARACCGLKVSAHVLAEPQLTSSSCLWPPLCKSGASPFKGRASLGNSWGIKKHI